MKLSLISLIDLTISAMLHDMGILRTETYPSLEKLDDMYDAEVQKFVEEHQRLSSESFEKSKWTLLPQTRKNIAYMIGNHHSVDITSEKPKSALTVLYLVEIVDEMICPLPHKIRYNFSPSQLQIVSRKMAKRNGINLVLLSLVKLYRNSPNVWPAVVALAELFDLPELTVEDYEQKLKEIFDICPYGVYKPHPSLDGNSVPRMVYCNDREKKYDCKHRSQTEVAIQMPSGKMQQFLKCGTETNMLLDLNKQSKPLK